jgi:hypothetical protein
VKAAGPGARLGQDAPGHPLGRGQRPEHRTVPQMPRPIPARSRERRTINPTIITTDRHEHTRPSQAAVRPDWWLAGVAPHVALGRSKITRS